MRQKYYPPASLHAQRGIATILVVVLVGLALTATSLGLVHSIRNTQEKQIAVHAATNAQIGVWAGVEAFRRYLNQVPLDQVPDLAGDFDMAFLGDYGNLSIRNVTVEPGGAGYRVKAEVVNIHPAAKSSATVGVVFEVADSGCTDCVVLTTALDFHDDLDLGGDINFIPPADSVTRINVDGDVAFDGITVTGVNQVYATGSVFLNSGVQLEEIYSNEDVTLIQSAWADLVKTAGNVSTDGGAGIGVIWANGNVNLNGNRRSEAINSRSNVTITMNSHGKIILGGDFSTSGNGAGTMDEIRAKGNVSVVDPHIVVGTAVGESNLLCPTPGWSQITSGSFNGLAIGCASTTLFTDKVSVGASNNVEIMNELPDIVIPRFVVDVWTLKAHANYAFEWDAAVGATKVTIKDVNGIADGEYYIGNYSGPEKSRICTTVDSRGNCTSPGTPLGSICLGHSLYNECLLYSTRDSRWTLDGISSAPGIMWFDGDVNMNNGYNYTTIFATGNIDTGGQFRGVSVNYGGYSSVCEANAPDIDATNAAIFKGLFQDQYPSNLCDKSSASYTGINAGNIGLAAGGYNPDDGGAYSGGNIHLSSSNEVYGAVLAGSYLTTGGSTKVFGYVTAAATNVQGTADNVLGGSTTVDLTKETEHYKPAFVPDMTDGACPDCDGLGGDSGDERARVYWSRYM